MLQPVRGTHDIYGDFLKRYKYVLDTVYRVAYLYGYQEIITPIFEYTSVFQKNLGETSDIVSKEMYQFFDKGGESLTLRPEHTAAIMRAVLSEKLYNHLPLKLISSGPTFRYDRPQKGRYRQFTQVGVECIGPSHPLSDSEIIGLAYHIFQELRLASKINLEINSLGDQQSRNHYREKLFAYFSAYKKGLSEDSQKRLERNPLRILDSKSLQDQKLIQEAPLFQDSMTKESRSYFDEVLQGLERLHIPFTYTPKLVRGLDYYCHTAFEFTTSHLGTQSTVLAGGRYNGLSEQMEGPSLPAIGWAGGVERISLLLEDHLPTPPPIFLIAVSQDEIKTLLSLSCLLREKGHKIDFFYQGNLQKQLKRAHKMHAKIAILIGEEEVKNQEALVRCFETGKQEKVHFDQLDLFLRSF